MRVRQVIAALVVSAGVATLSIAIAAQAPARGAAQPPARGAAPPPARGAAQPPARGAAPAAPATCTPQGVCGNLMQIMRGILFPNSNIVFDVQDNNPATKKPDPNGPFLGNYQGWEGVEQAGLALAESANLVLMPGRKCSNGQPVPLTQPDFVASARALRTLGMEIYNKARTKNQDMVADLADKIAETCANCHDKYRPDSRIGGAKVGPEKRCMAGV